MTYECLVFSLFKIQNKQQISASEKLYEDQQRMIKWPNRKAKVRIEKERQQQNECIP